MTPTELRRFYSSRKEHFTTLLRPVQRKIAWVAHSRLAVALAFVGLLYFGLTSHNLLFMLPATAAVFVILVRYHGRLYSTKEHLENLVDVNDRELRILERSFGDLDSGARFVDHTHPYTHDLDIFGEGSLYQFLNRCNTLSGKRKFASALAHPPESEARIRLCAEAIRELSFENEFRQELQAAGLSIEEQEKDRAQLLDWTQQPAFLFGNVFYRIILWVVPILTLTLIVAAFFNGTLRTFAVLMAGLQWGFVGLHLKRVSRFHEYIGRKKNILQKYSALLRQLQRKNFSSPLMQKLSREAEDADRKVKQLASLVRAFDARLNSMTFLVVNSVLLYDLQCVYRLERWKALNAPHFERWLESAAETEVLCSFGTFAFNHPKFVFPAIHARFAIDAKGLGHPLIPADECVLNDVSIGDLYRVMIVTGANMAGKSTFLRTVGINMVLAMNGAPVFATSFQCPVVRLRTGMRTADSLKDHQSYFYAELDRLSGIMNELRQNTPLLILLDEILKGTNSTDKQTGSIALVKQLLPHPCLGVIATHDLALGQLEQEHPSEVRNFCFEANIENDQLSFDYKLKPGLATRMNATFLMKKMGIIPS